METFLSGLLDEGFSDEAALEAYRAYTSFLLGHLLLEVAVHGADVGPLDVLDDQTDDARPRRVPDGRAAACGRCQRTTRPSSSRRHSRALLDRMTITRNEHIDGLLDL